MSFRNPSAMFAAVQSTLRRIGLPCLSPCVWLALLCGAPLASGADRPNIILCMADDLGWGDTGYNGHPLLKTPHLDAMAREGVTFHRWYAGAPVCSPTRANCLTGRHPLRMGITTANSGHMLPSEHTLAEVLRAEGYRTGHFGKWHLGTLTTTMRDSNRGKPGNTKDFAPPWQHGFETCFSSEAKVPTYDPMKKPKGVKTLRYGWQPAGDGATEPYGTHYFDETGKVIRDNLDGDDSRVIMDRAIPFVRRAAQADKPFFAVIWFHAPHLPVVAGPKHAGLYPDQPWKEQMYFGCISALDDQMGRLRAELDKLGIADQTMLWFSSDNGPENGTPGSAKHLRARKRSLHEGGIRVPGLLVWPNGIAQPHTVTAPCHSGDYFSTVLSAARIAVTPGTLDSQDLGPLLREERQDRGSLIHFEYRGQATVIGDRYKLYRAGHEKAWELFDLSEDPAEKSDLSATMPDRRATMAKSFTAWQASRQP